ncbi:hypothetical protein GW17_00045963 [Ensete ventricosum]|nr:hypothetical protein GW17_00045963 [Ensete ventricosum]
MTEHVRTIGLTTADDAAFRAPAPLVSGDNAGVIRKGPFPDPPLDWRGFPVSNQARTTYSSASHMLVLTEREREREEIVPLANFRFSIRASFYTSRFLHCGCVYVREMKYVLVTGGVVSGLGKGVTASSIGILLKACGLRLTAIKIGTFLLLLESQLCGSQCHFVAFVLPRMTYLSFVVFFADPYLNTDAGTMSPFEHGEVFVLDDGGEVSNSSCDFFIYFSQVDLDLGNYERFLDVKLTCDNSITTGKIYQVPNISMPSLLTRTTIFSRHNDSGILDAGDIESMPFLEALGQFSYRVGEETCLEYGNVNFIDERHRHRYEVCLFTYKLRTSV